MPEIFQRLTQLFRKVHQLTDEERQRELLEIEGALTSSPPDVNTEILWMLTVARDRMELRQLDDATASLDRAEELIKDGQLAAWLPELYRLRSVILLRRGLTEEAFELLVRAYTAGESEQDQYSLAHTSLNLGVISANNGDYDGASVYLKRCLEHAAEGNFDPNIPAQAHLVLAQAQLERGAMNDADHHAGLALEQYQQLGNELRAATAATMLASVKIENRDLISARNVLGSIDTSRLAKVQIISFSNLLAKLNSLEGKFQEAITKHDEAIALCGEVSTVRLLVNSVQLKCETLLQMEAASETLELLSRWESDPLKGYNLLSYHELRGKALEQLGQYKDALEEQKQFAKLQKELLSERASNALSRLRAAQEVLQAEREAAHFRERSQFYAKELSQRTSYLVQQNEYVNEVIDHLQSLAAQKPEAIELLKDIRKRLRQLPGASFDWNEYLRLFDEIHPNALAVLEQKYPDLSKTESKICTLVLAKLQNVEIARLLSVSERTVENHRYRLRKKLGLSVDVDLTAFLEQLVSEQSQRTSAK
jgi:DNA-binding CsgD family transcriptional regulator